MCKKIAIVAVAVVAGMVLLYKTNAGSYLSFSWKKGKELINRQVPPEVEIERLRHELTQIDPEIKKACTALAEEAWAVEQLQKEVQRTQVSLKARLDEILTMKKDLENGTEPIVYGGTRYSASTVKVMLARDWDSYKRSEEALKNKQNLLEAKEAGLAQGHKQLADMKGLKEQLETELAQVETELKTLRLAQTRSGIQFDNNRITRFNDSLKELQKRLAVEKKAMEYHAQFANHTATPDKGKADAADKAIQEINARFNDKVATGR